MLVVFERFILNGRVEMMETFTLEQPGTIFLRVHYKEDLTKSFSDTDVNCGDLQHILKMNFLRLLVMTRMLRCGVVINLFGHHRFEFMNSISTESLTK